MLKINKNVFNSDEKFNAFVEILKQASTVFQNRQNETVKEYRVLLDKKEHDGLEPQEEEKFFELYKRLVS